MMEAFQEELDLYENNADLLKVLAHPVRLCLVKGLIEKGSCNVSTMYTGLNMPQSTVSQHLAKLKSAKIVASERKGLEIYYKVENEKVIQIMKDLFL
ncbi:metalloregulator ArsR/SmtB family transcription factor [Bacillus sp. 165]|uniref:ArsR/SmtB family transcription factor n=1 Tax=Bacillus sp. 165 TaxID=1529117 RepID=UPI001ADB382A|nr:metalloregulator ArsR/SmtB family transcription factor [Bacillus sp. 165]MBO9129645.1 helix-turn-helix transcriptional regulator [Bacillus sp. 165]